MPANFGTTPLSTTTIGSNQFPVSAGYVPNSSGSLTSIQLGPASTDAGGYTSAPIATYTPDGNSVTLGTTTDASSANTLIGLTKAIKANTASITVGSLPALSAGSNTIGNVGIVAGSALIGSVELVDSGGTNKAAISAGGAVKVDGSAATQPISGTVTANQGGSWTVTATIQSNASINVAQIAGTTTDTNTGNASAGTQRVVLASNQPALPASQSGSWTVTANAGTNLNTSALALDTSVNGVLLSQGSATSGQKGPLLQGAVTTSAPSYTTTQTSPLSLTTAGALRVDASATTQPVSGTVTANAGSGTFTVAGTVTANIGTTNGLTLDATVAKLNVAQATALGSNTGPMMQGSVTTNAPSYTTGNINPLSLDTSGLLRASLKDTPSNTNNFNVNIAASAATVAVTGTVTANQGGSNWSTNVAQFGGSNVATGTGTSGTGIPRVTVSNDSNVLVTQSGTWTIQPGNTANTTPWLVQDVAGTSGGSTASHTMSAATTNATSLKASTGTVYGLSISNANASARYFKLYNKASSPTVGTDTPVLTLQVPGSGTVIRAYPKGLALSTGIAWAATGGIADNDTTAIGVNDCSIDIDYK